ncbi:acyltransferase family protein [Paenibacillus oceani]|uniref:Acyltransferase n=1 Tax=Paenibacillus oceani TaxID=2772510 RepID=A0A927CH95_9BACL|nr:acyltransferase [Paenibacillus oceani]MBD2866181.1 acyltransferase [Paenibacillus oceani]
MKRLDSLQALRGIAALMVVIYHATYQFESYYNYKLLDGFFYFGYWGVDLFFVLSGFIIFYIHHGDIGRRIRLGSFIRKRFIRIFPIYWIITFLLIPLFLLVPSFGGSSVRELDVILKSILLFPQSVHPVLGVAWTLTHELFFYLMFSLLIMLPRKWSYPLFAAWISITIGLFICSFWIDFKSMNYYIKFIFSSYNLEFLLGVLVAKLLIRYKDNILRYTSMIASIGIAGLAATWMVYYFGIFTPHRVISWALFSAFLILGFTLIESKKNIAVPKLFRYLGDASYSIYLTHDLWLSIINKIYRFAFQQVNLVSAAIIIIGATLAGCLFYSIIEKPVLHVLRGKQTKKEQEGLTT